MMYYVYVLKSREDGKLYIGSTNNLKLRFAEHNNGKVTSTFHRRPLALVYYEAYGYEKQARQREKRLKQFGKAYQELKKRIFGEGGAG